MSECECECVGVFGPLAHNTFHLMPCYKCGIFRICFCFFPSLLLLFSALFLYALAVYRHQAATIRSFLSFFRNGLYSRLVCWLVGWLLRSFCWHVSLFIFGYSISIRLLCVRYKWGNNIPCGLSKLCMCVCARARAFMSWQMREYEPICVPNSSYASIASLGVSILYIVQSLS